MATLIQTAQFLDAKFGKAASEEKSKYMAEQKAASFKASVGLPLATLAEVQDAAKACYHAGNPAYAGLPVDAWGGHPGSNAYAYNAILLGLQGKRVDIGMLQTVLATLTIDNKPAGGNFDNIMADRCGKKCQHGLPVATMVGTAKKGGWIAVNPIWTKTVQNLATTPRTETVVDRETGSIEQAPGLDKAAEAMAEKQATPKRTPKAEKPRTRKPQTAKQVEASKKATSADLASGASIKASK